MRDYEIHWEEYEYDFSEKSTDWFWALGIVAISIAVTAVILNNFLFAILILVGAFALAIYAVREPNLVIYEVNQRGVVVEDKLYLYNSLDSFWIDYTDEKPKLLISSKKMLMPHIVIPIGDDVDTNHLRDYLLDYVDEEEQGGSLSTIIMKYLGF
ncbi:MAG TPA: hypothetical protein QGH03_01995 [Candidatus Paceibacterota bacterium]|jgi:hypothetical protein|nr:hypothetical protein [Candidatus Paceibacterota bacterium]|tara:strand:+ start:1459 stop:1923 length:465 start_codon:yes stop_codon:yes gene_type:complete